MMSTTSNPSENRVREIFLEALRFENPEARQGFLKQACADNQKLLERVETLLAHHKEDSFMEAPAADAPTLELDTVLLDEV